MQAADASCVQNDDDDDLHKKIIEISESDFLYVPTNLVGT